MAEETELMNVPTDAATEKYRTPNVNPQFDTESKDVSFGKSKDIINNGSKDVTIGGVGQPVQNTGA